MDAMTLRSGDVFTEVDLAALPDDGNRYELVDGSLIVTPSPRHHHQRAAFSIARLLHAVCPSELEVLLAPFDVRLSATTVLQPDVLVARRAEIAEMNLPATPLLAVEVLSPSTRYIDLGLKRSRYEAAGCPAYWVVDPATPSVTAWQLVDAVYVEAAHVVGEEVARLRSPFAVTVVPGRLVD